MTRTSDKGRYTSPDGSAMWEYICVMSCTSLVFCSGCITGWNSPTLGKLSEPDSSLKLTSSQESTLTSIASLGNSLAPLLTMIMADKLGRKNSVVVSGIPVIISWLLISTSKNIIVLYAARFIGGFSFGLISCVTPMYLGEIASPNLRGTIGTVCGIMFVGGLLFMFAIVPYLSVSMMACVCLSIVTAATVSAWFIPESPYYLGMVGRFDEAEGVLEKLRGKTDVTEELELIKNTVRQEDDSKLNEMGSNSEAPNTASAFKLLFTVRGNRKAVNIMMLLLGALYFGSPYIMTVYSDRIFKKMDAGLKPQLCTLIIGVIQMVTNIVVALVIDKAGRRPLILIWGLVSGFCVMIVAVYFYLIEHTVMDVTPYGPYALCAIFLNMIAANIGAMPLAMVLQTEIFSTEIKALAITIIGVFGGVFGTISAKSYLTVAETWGYGHAPPFFAFAAVTWASMVLILMLLPETKGKTLLDIQRALNEE